MYYVRITSEGGGATMAMTTASIRCVVVAIFFLFSTRVSWSVMALCVPYAFILEKVLSFWGHGFCTEAL